MRLEILNFRSSVQPSLKARLGGGPRGSDFRIQEHPGSLAHIVGLGFEASPLKLTRAQTNCC